MKLTSTYKLVVFAATIVVIPASSLNAGLLSVDATANIFGAGLSIPPGFGTPGSASNGTTPPSVLFGAAAQQVLSFSSVSGSVSFGGQLFCPADGCVSGFDGVSGTNFNPQGGISGIIDNPGNFFFLAGVFLTDVPSSSAPPTLDFTGNQNFTILAPQIGQVFFIGDGVNNLAQTQIFDIPANATRLFLGFADGNGFTGDPGFYNDNAGSLTTAFDITRTPEPASLALSAAGLMLVAFRRRKPRSA